MQIVEKTGMSNDDELRAYCSEIMIKSFKESDRNTLREMFRYRH